MAFYTSVEPGKPITSPEAETKIAASFLLIGDAEAGTLESKLYWGFASKTLLESLLEEPGCVGIRFYNAFRKDIQSKMIVVAVTEDGDEIERTREGDSGYFVNRLKFSDEQETNLTELAINHISREVAAQRVLASYRETGRADLKISFASFFSAHAILTLLQPEDCNGICFYVVGLETSGKFPFSHLAVAVKHSKDENSITRLGETGRCIVCPDPCPSRCAKDPVPDPSAAGELTDSVEAGAARAPVIQSSLSRKYLISWE